VSAKRRTQFPGAIYHVNSRGNDGRDIYHDDYDREHFLDALAKTVEKEAILVHAFVLMTNHWHGLIETPHGNIADALQRINWTHACRFNRRHGYRNHLFGEPYHDELIEDDAHFLEAVRYIVLNPVRAGICALPEHWAWSSFSATVGLSPAPAFLTSNRVLGYFGPDPARACTRCVSFVHEGIGMPRAATSLYQVKGRGRNRRAA
jgi:REP-associated tyrosine transposase